MHLLFRTNSFVFSILIKNLKIKIYRTIIFLHSVMVTLHWILRLTSQLLSCITRS